MSPPDVRLWNLLRRSPNGFKFRRQHSIGPYVADFYCPAARLVIEIDGQVHNFDARADRDEARDSYMRNLGLRVIRVAAAEVFADAQTVAEGLLLMCSEAAGPSTTQLR